MAAHSEHPSSGEVQPLSDCADGLRLVARPVQRDPDNPQKPPEDGHWEALGTFIVEFQRAIDDPSVRHSTTAHHMESGETSQWHGIVTGALLSWMLGRLVRSNDQEITP